MKCSLVRISITKIASYALFFFKKICSDLILGGNTEAIILAIEVENYRTDLTRSKCIHPKC